MKTKFLPLLAKRVQDKVMLNTRPNGHAGSNLEVYSIFYNEVKLGIFTGSDLNEN